LCHAANIGVFDDRKCSISKFFYDLNSRIYINKIVVRKFFTIQLIK